MNMEMDERSIIKNEYDYSNVLPEVEKISRLVKYCDDVLKQFMSLVNEDEEKNEKIKYEFKNYNYKKTYGQSMNVKILTTGNQLYRGQYLECNDYESFNTAINNNLLKNISSLEISLELNYQRGSISNLVSHENKFKIVFRPYDITFTRISNFNEQSMMQIENGINKFLSDFTIANSIFCTK